MDAAAGLRSSVPGLVKISAAVTILGGYPFTLGVAISATLILLARKQWRPALLLLATVLLERLVVELLKDWIGRPRPLLAHLPNSLAFPSGHSANSMPMASQQAVDPSYIDALATSQPSSRAT